MRQHKQILLGNIDKPNRHTVSGYEETGGYKAIRKALKMKPEEIREEVKASGIRGRGGAGFPTGVKWGFIPNPEESGKPVYIVQNADESEPGTFKDRLLLENDPHATIEGMIIAALALRSHYGVIYIRGEYAYPYMRTQQAIKECYEKGYLGEKIFGSDYKFDLVIHRGAGAYICGEETALLNSLEGRKGQPRLKPPFFPGAIGLYNMPTLVNNTETFAALPYIINEGAKAYSSVGTEKSTGTKLFSASGHINKPGVYEVEMGYPILEFIENECGGIRNGNKLKGVIAGGSSMPILRADELEGVNLDFESLQEAGTYLGSGGFMVMDETTDMVEVALNIAHFYTHESCGQCTPCREGGHWIEKIFEKIARDQGKTGDVELVNSVANNVEGHTICAFGEALAWPAKAFIEKFPDEFEARIKGAESGKPMKKESLNFPIIGH